MASTLHLVDVNIENNIAIVQINNPPLNVLGKKVVQDLLKVFMEIEKITMYEWLF